MNLLAEMERGGKRIVGAAQEYNWLISGDKKKTWKLLPELRVAKANL
jgi:hypothetical protein